MRRMVMRVLDEALPAPVVDGPETVIGVKKEKCFDQYVWVEFLETIG
jgi:hypothetical protein